MDDPKDRFRSLDHQSAPDLWSEATSRAQATPTPSRLPSMGAGLAVVAVLVLAAALGIQFGGWDLIGGPGPSDMASAVPSAGEPEASAPALPSTPAEPAFTCDMPITLERTGSDFHPLITQDIQVSVQDGFDRITFVYNGGTPEVEINIAETPYFQDPSGLPMTVNGSPVYRLVLHGATKYDTETGEQPYTGPVDFGSDELGQIVQFVESGDFEATHSWYIGLDGAACMRAVADPGQGLLSIDVQHGAASANYSPNGEFRLAIHSSRPVWRTDEAIQVGAILSYRLDEATTLRGSGSGLIGFSLEELTGDRQMGAAYNSDCAPHLISWDDPVVAPYAKSGGFSPDDPDAAFWEAFFADPEFHLPPGQWRITAETSFDNGPDCTANPTQISTSIVLTITE